jgi:hypothetical protein
MAEQAPSPPASGEAEEEQGAEHGDEDDEDDDDVSQDNAVGFVGMDLFSVPVPDGVCAEGSAPQIPVCALSFADFILSVFFFSAQIRDARGNPQALALLVEQYYRALQGFSDFKDAFDDVPAVAAFREHVFTRIPQELPPDPVLVNSCKLLGLVFDAQERSRANLAWAEDAIAAIERFNPSLQP